MRSNAAWKKHVEAEEWNDNDVNKSQAVVDAYRDFHRVLDATGHDLDLPYLVELVQRGVNKLARGRFRAFRASLGVRPLREVQPVPQDLEQTGEELWKKFLKAHSDVRIKQFLRP